MVTIDRHNNGFKIKFSNPGTGTRGFFVKAKDAKEVCASITHYYDGTDIKHRGQMKGCPLCRTMEDKE